MSKLATALTCLLIVMFAMTGALKLFTPYADLVDQMAWVEEFEEWQVRAIAVLELAGAAGLLVSLATRRMLWAARFAPLGLAALMVGAIGTHISISDPFGQIAPSIVGLVMAGALAWLRWTSAPLTPRAS